MLVVWEPILVTDWGSPSASTLARISDIRARQFWDPGHLISNALKEMAAHRPSQPATNSGKGFYWDQAMVYAPHSQWERAPQPTFWKGPVYRVTPGLEEALSRSRSPAIVPVR